MKITEVKTRRFRFPHEDRPFHPTWRPWPEREQDVTIVEVHTDEGITGVGGGGVLTRLNTVGLFFNGRDPLLIEDHVRTIAQIAYFMGRPWPLEVALWDIAGKAAGLPLWKLLGGARDRLLAYASTGEIHSPEQRVEDVLRMRDVGFKAVKLRFHAPDPKDDIPALDAVRKAVGDTMTIMVDANNGWRLPGDVTRRWDRKTAIEMAQVMEEYDVFWLEEPLWSYDYDGLAELRSATNVRIAGGELNLGLFEFQTYFEKGCFDVYQPDATFVCGISGARKIAAMAEAQGLLFAPHTWSNGLGVAANMAVAASVPNSSFFEFPFDPPNWTPEQRDFLLTEPITTDAEGYVRLPDRPGLGVELDEEKLRRYEVGS